MKILRLHFIVSSCLIFSLLIAPLTAESQVRAIYDRGAAGLGQQLKRLQTTASAMHTAAHPDDEDSGLLAYLARREMARTSYLSLNRGEGGQNVIGTELFENLGVIRTEELLQARRLDGGEQYFTRVMDYGFSKTLKEAKTIWGEEKTLGDMVRAIRMFRPLVVISRFSGTPADGHGQHQMAGYLTPIAFKAAADPTKFPEHFKEGLKPWQAKKLYVSQSFVNNPANQPTLVLNTGEYDKLIGRSYFEIAMEGRSQHKSQEMGLLELRGKFTSGMRLVENFAGKVEKETSVFDGIDTTIKGIAKLADDSNSNLPPKLAALQETAELALKSYDIYAPEKLIPILARGYKQAEEAEWSTRDPESKWYLQQKQNEFAEALRMAAGLTLDALSDTEMIVAGDLLGVTVKIFAPETTKFSVKSVSLSVPKGWTAKQTNPPTIPTIGFRSRSETASAEYFFDVNSSITSKLTQPYWLENPRNKDFTFDWNDADSKNLPFQKNPLTAEAKLEIGGAEITVKKDVEYRYADDIRGEIRRNPAIVPQVAVAVDSDLIIAPKSNKPGNHRVAVSVTNNAPRQTKGVLSLNLPANWKSSPNSADFLLKQRGEKTAIVFDVTIPANSASGDYKITANANVGGQNFDHTQTAIAYPHIQTHYRFTKTEISAKVLNLKVSPVKIGYIMGSGDKVPEAIKRLGLDVQMLEEKDLATGDLARFDTIVVGIRASQVRPDFVANNNRLLDYVRNGGTLIVQYQQQEFIRENLLPFPAKMENVINGTQRISNVRVVDENAPVKILAPDNMLFNFPNKITSADFDNWIQERNLYTLTQLAPEYTALLETRDEGEPPVTGGLVIAKFGKGNYIYNAYSFFRQLPTGNSGAYRLFANMLSLSKAKK